jgi:D-amino-acid dehydrogenase
MEVSGADAAPDPRKPAQLRVKLRRLGFHPADDGASWKGPRPVLPDYLPGIGKAPGAARLYYSIGQQHIGLTIAPVCAELVADLVAGREPRLGIDAFSLRRFGPSHA